MKELSALYRDVGQKFDIGNDSPFPDIVKVQDNFELALVQV